MKKLFIIMSFIFLLISSAFAIPDYNDNEQQLDTMIEAGENILLVFGASWCGPCQKMKDDVWTDQSIIDLTNTLGVKRFYFDTDQFSSLASKWGLTTIPTWLTLKGTEIIEKSGSMTKAGVERTLAESFQ